MNDIIYMDNNATTRVAPEVLEAMLPYFSDRYGNSSSIHKFGGSVKLDIEKARNQVAELIGADYRDKENVATEIIFTSGGTESDNTALYVATTNLPERKRIVTTCVEHPAILSTVREYERKGYEIILIPVDRQGRLDMEFAKEAINSDTAIVSIMWANSEIGNIYDIEALADMAKAQGAFFHTDAVQAAGRVSLNVANSKIDMLSISGHKIHGPKGIGALYVRRGMRFRPLIIGGHQERGRRGGTENVPGIIGFGKACKIAKEDLDKNCAHITKLRDYLETEITQLIPKVHVNGDLSNRLANTASISFDDIEGESILSMLSMHGICASSGSACTTGSLEPSHVLMAMKIPYTSAHGTIRFSLSKYNTKKEVDKVLEVLPNIIKTLRKMSPFWEE